MKTVQDLINEERERKNPKYEDILVSRIYGGGTERFSEPSNIKHDGEWLEFDTICDVTEIIPDSVPVSRHVKTKGTIVEFIEIRK